MRKENVFAGKPQNEITYPTTIHILSEQLWEPQC
jgi:hypothetical protein